MSGFIPIIPVLESAVLALPHPGFRIQIIIIPEDKTLILVLRIAFH